MGVLGNPKYEKFAQEFHRLVWTGTKASIARVEAYLAAGYDNTAGFAAPNARKLCQRPEIKTRLAELSENSEFLACTDAAWAQRKLRALVDSNLDDYLAPADANGVRRFDISKVSREKLGLLLELAQDEETEIDGETEEVTRIRKIRIKRSDPIQALALMAKIAGWLAPEKQEHSGGLTLETLVAQSMQKPALPAPEPAAESAA